MLHVQVIILPRSAYHVINLLLTNTFENICNDNNGKKLNA